MGQTNGFLYVWQTCIQAPLVMASAAIGFAEYLNYLYTTYMVASKLVSARSNSGHFFIVRKIEAIGKISIIMWVSVFIVFFWIISVQYSWIILLIL